MLQGEQQPGRLPVVQLPLSCRIETVGPAGNGERADARQGRQGERAGTREGLQGRRADARDGRQGDRADRRANRGDNRPDRIENRGERREQRNERRDEVRDQFLDNHPRYDFWKDHPNWARWRWNRPYRWATWGLITGFLPWGLSDASYYSYGENVYYEDDTVYYGDEAVASSAQYAEQAQTIVENSPEIDDSADWLPLGVFAITQDGESSGPPPTLFVQLAVNKQGIIAGTFQNTANEESKEVEGMARQENATVGLGHYGYELADHGNWHFELNEGHDTRSGPF